MFGGCDDPFTKASKLLLIGHVQEQFDKTNAIVDEHLLEGVDLVIGPPPLLRTGQAFDPFDQHSPVPGSVEDRDIAGKRQPLPEALEIMAALLLRAGPADRPDLHPARVELSDQSLDSSALA